MKLYRNQVDELTGNWTLDLPVGIDRRPSQGS
jgi:hypothetical protein